MANFKVSDRVEYIGVDDREIDLFESQYKVPEGISYNSYLINDEKTVLMDTADSRKTHEWMNNLEIVLNGKSLDYIVCLHMEPDHAGSLKAVLEKHQEAVVIGNAKTFAMINRFFDIDIENRKEEVKDGDTKSFGKSSLTFIFAPMVHWPEVMFAYEADEKILFSADAFGKFGALDAKEDWVDEGRRYYFNIVGKYGPQVQAVLKKAAALEINTICPLHGPILKESIGYCVEKYDIWSKYQPEDKGIVIACGSIHGNTLKACYKLKELLEEKTDDKVLIFDLSRCDMSSAIENAFRYDRLVLACATYNAGMFPPMEQFLHHLKAKNFQNRKIGFMENGTWAPTSGKQMKEIAESMKNMTLCENLISISSTVKEETVEQMKKMAEELI